MMENTFVERTKFYLDKAINSVRFVSENQVALLVFLFGTSLYIYSHVSLIAQPLQFRVVPIEADDAYSYIHKALQLEDCFFQDCPAMIDLKAQLLAPTDDEGIAAQRYRQAHRVINQYHPLHSLLLLGLRKIGISFENGYNLFYFIGAVLLPTVIAYWLSRLWGFGPAGIGIALASFHNFLGQGTYFIVPSNLTLLIALLVFASILKNRERSNLTLLAGIFLMIAMHNIGQLYSLVGLALFFLSTKERFSRRSLTTLLIGLAFLISSFLIPDLIKNPVTNLSPYQFTTEELNYRQEFQTNLTILNSLFIFWATTYESPSIVLILVSLGFLFTAYQRKWDVFIMGGLLAALLIASLFYVIPWYPGVAVTRLWLPFAILLTGSLGQCFWLWLKGLYHGLLDLKNAKTANSLDYQRAWFFLILSVLSFIFAYNLYQSANVHSNKHFTSLENHITHNKDLFFDTDQRDYILRHASSGDTVLYTSETAFYYYLAQDGFYNLGAVFSPAVIGSSEQDVWVNNDQNIRYIVGGSVLNKIESVSQGRIVLSAGDRLVVHSEIPFDLSNVQFKFATPNRISLIKIQYELDGEKETETIELTNNSKGWLNLDLEKATLVQEFTFLANSGFILVGIQIEPMSSELNWPWNQEVELRYIPKSDIFKDLQPSSARLSTDFFEGMLGTTLNIISDNGSNILLEVSK